MREDRYLLEDVSPWYQTEDFTLRDLNCKRKRSDEKIVLSLVSNYKRDGALPILLLENQKKLNSKYSWLDNFVSKPFTSKQGNFPVNLTLKTVHLVVYVISWCK